MKRSWRRLRANYHYLRRPFLQFLPLLGFLVVILLVGSFCFHHLYRQEPMSYIEALYVTYCLVFMEHLVDFPEHWLLRLFYFVLPLLGLVVILDGFVRFGYHVLRRSDNAREWMRALAKTHNNHVILCGLGRVGLRTLQQLLILGEEVVIMEKNPDNQNIAFAKKHEVPVIIGGGREEGILEELNIRSAKSIICATDDDLANLELALDARQLKPRIRVVLRMFDQELASKVRDSFGIDLAFSTAAQAAPLFATSSSDRSIENSFYVGDALLVVAQLEVNPDSELVGKKIRDIGSEHRIFFLSHERGTNETHFPSAETEFQVGDVITVQTDPNTLQRGPHLESGSRTVLGAVKGPKTESRVEVRRAFFHQTHLAPEDSTNAILINSLGTACIRNRFGAIVVRGDRFGFSELLDA